MFRTTRLLACDSNMAAVHPQPSQDSLPPGWECRFDPRTGQYYFLNHLEHITTWEDPRLRHADIQQGSYAKYYLYGMGRPPSGPVKSYTPYYGGSYPSTATPPPPPPPAVPMPQPVAAHVTNGGYSPQYGSPRAPYRFKESNVQVDERILMKLCVQFPTVEEGHIWQLLKQYHNRENVVVSALLAEGQPRAQTHSVDLTPKLQRSETHSFQVDEALYFKLRNFFPAADPDHIRNLQKLYNNQEHEVIASLVAGNRGQRHQSPHPSSPKMKLRYLKLVFPEADEAILFDVLNNCDNNAQEASSRLVGMGYKKRDTPITRPNISQPFQRPISEVPRPILTPERPIIVIPPSASDKIQLVSKLQEQFPAVSRTLVNMALDSSNYNEDRAKQFLAAMTPQDINRPVVPQIETSRDSTVESSPLHTGYPAEAPAVPPRSRHASASQESDTGSGSRHSSLERHSLRGDSSHEVTPSKSPSHRGSVSSPARSISSPAHKVTGTGTEKTFRQKFKREILKKDYLPWVGPDPKNHKGPDPTLRRGPDPNNLGTKKESRAKGPQRDLCRGPLSNITHVSSTITSGSAETVNTRSS